MPRFSFNRANWKVVVALVAGALALVVGVTVAAGSSPGVSPASYDGVLALGSSVTIEKTVTTPEIPPNPDVVFLSDTTGSMGPAIANVQANVNTITGDVLTAQPTAQFGVAQYKDGDPAYCGSDPFAFYLDLAVTASTTNVATAVGTWGASGGCDLAESQLYALHQLATNPAVGWRTGSTRIVAWFGDAPGHDPALGVTLAQTIAALQAADITVIAVNVLNLGPQAAAITAATGGVLLPAGGDVSGAILAGLQSLPVEVTPVATCDTGLTATFDPTSQTVTSGTAAVFDETLTVAPDAPTGYLECTVDFELNGETVDGFQQKIRILAYAYAPGGGSFVIGDKSAKGAVTFWGAQWWKLNVLSGGPAPSAFKGFALNPSVPACGTDWSTDPGNSAPPPAGPLPDYMGVIVTSQAAKSGSAISGDTRHIVVVKTNAGYAPNPGHAGTGTVVATVC